MKIAGNQQHTVALLGLGHAASSIRSGLATVCGFVLLHHGEGQHLLDAVIVGEEHNQAVNAHAPATSWRQPVLEGSAERLVNKLRLIITLLLLTSLFLKALALNKT